MSEYLLIPGRLPGVSLAEVSALSYDVKSAGAGVFLVATSASPEAMQKRLGGVIKLARVMATLPRESSLHKVTQEIKKLLPRTGKKYSWGVSVVAGGVKAARLDAWRRDLHRLCLGIKKELSAAGQSTRLVVSREVTLSSAALVQSNIMRDGCEVVVALFPDQIIIGQTVTTQDLDAYTIRDVGRPARHVRRGMLPVKVAQTMINLARVPAGGIILDPFCGVGTILQEAMRLGYEARGSDRDTKAVEATEKNLTWYVSFVPSSSPEGEGKGGDECSPTLPPPDYRGRKKYAVSSFFVKQCLVENLQTGWNGEKFDAIITEPDLGPIHPEQWNDVARARLEALYQTAFAQFQRVLKPGGTVVFLFPVIGRQKKEFMPDKLFKNIFALGFVLQPLLTGELAGLPFVALTPRGTMVYSRPEQFVAREIAIFSKLRTK